MDNTYLIWVGSESYPTIKDWVDEANSLGVSKRLPNANVGMALNKPGTVIFVAHDEGNWKECSDCLGEIENPEWRKKEEKLLKYMKEIAFFQKELDEVTAQLLSAEKEEVDSLVDLFKKQQESLSRKIVRRKTKIALLEDETKDVKERIQGGTGGSVKLARAGVVTYVEEVVDYRKYDYWHHQPKKFDQRWQKTGKPNMCKTCGGKGNLPEARIFGLFIPSSVEYILKPEDGAKVEEEMLQRGFRTISTKKLKIEAKRKCGNRKEGGVYVVTDRDAGRNKLLKKIVDKMISDGIIESDKVDIRGNFVHFLAPIPVEEKRFRGIKRWSVEDRDIKEAAEMIIDALE